MGQRLRPCDLEKIYKEKVGKLNYKMVRFDAVDWSFCNLIMYRKQRGYGKKKTYNDVWLMLDTETSRKEDAPKDEKIPWENHICAWTLSVRVYHKNIITIYGNKPSEAINTLCKLHDHLRGELTYCYIHNLPFDWQFLRKFFFERLGYPESQLNIKSHYMINIAFSNGIILKDSLILAQKKLESWAKDLDVEHKKAVGFWDYKAIRNQDHIFTDEELIYIENDTLAGVECLDKTAEFLNKDPYSMPYTATGIIRSEVREIGAEYHAKELYKKLELTFEQYSKAEKIFHGGYCHSNRDIIGYIMPFAECGDENSAYPYTMVTCRFPMSGFASVSNCTIWQILDNAEEYAFMFKIVLIHPRLKDAHFPMPALQYSKAIHCVNPIIDSGRILAADLVEIYLNEIDAAVIAEQYNWDSHICCEVEVAQKDYLPRWFTDYIFGLYKKKCELSEAGIKGIDYSIAKGRLNSCYGMTVQRFVRSQIEELYQEGEFQEKEQDDEKEYYKYSHSQNTILSYVWGVWVTSYAFRNLFEIGKCVDYEHGGQWLYSDTDSVYASKWDYFKLYEYNNKCKEALKANGYGAVEINGREFWLGVVTSKGKEDQYSEFVTLGPKRYCGRCLDDNELHITVSGVPKQGVKDLNDQIENFKEEFVFKGTTSGKLCHFYIYVDNIYIDKFGNECGDSIDLKPCDYKLDSIFKQSETLWNMDTIQTYHYSDGKEVIL